MVYFVHGENFMPVYYASEEEAINLVKWGNQLHKKLYITEKSPVDAKKYIAKMWISRGYGVYSGRVCLPGIKV